MTERLPTPAEVLEAVTEAAHQIGQETGQHIPTVALRERACAILYQTKNEEARHAA